MDSRINQVLLDIIDCKAHRRRCVNDIVESCLLCLDNIIEGSWLSNVANIDEVDFPSPFRMKRKDFFGFRGRTDSCDSLVFSLRSEISN
jgi:hypothetical protein